MDSIKPEHILAIAIHPNYKSLSIIEKYMPEKRIDIEQHLSIYYGQDDASLSSECEEEEVYHIEMDEFVDKPNSKIAKKTEKNDIIAEYRKFVALEISEIYNNPLDFWRDSSFGHLKNAAKAIFVIQASSAEPERHNSAAGNMLTSKRNRLSPETLEKLVIYNECIKNE